MSASGGRSRPAKFSRMPARLSSAAPKPAVASSQVTRMAAPRIRSPATGTQPKTDHAEPERCQRAQSHQQVAIAVGRADHGAEGHPPPGIRLAHGVRDREVSADRADDHQERVDHDRERQQHDAHHAQDQARRPACRRWGAARIWPRRPVTNARPNECDTVSDTTSRFGRPNITRPKPSAPSVRKTPTTPARSAGTRVSSAWVPPRRLPAAGVPRR